MERTEPFTLSEAHGFSPTATDREREPGTSGLMKVRFQADADLNQDIVQAVRRGEPAIDFQTAYEAGLAGLHDNVILERATQEGRIVVSHDRRTMPHHFAAFIATQTSAGVIIVPKSLSIRQAVEDLILIWAASEADEWVNQINSLPL
jgi:hypothetical protein